MSESPAPRRRRWLAVVVFALALYVIVRASGTPQGDTFPPARASVTPPPSVGSASPSASAATGSSYDPAAYASQVRTRARQSGVSAQLLMAVLYNEAYKPHAPALERAWQKYKPDAAFGIANMHRATFDEVKRDRDFDDRRWEELPDDRDLAIEAEAWYLHDLAKQLPVTWSASFTKNELLALGYNTGASNMLAFARGATLGSQARSYLEKLRTNWAKAAAAVGED